jgi:hypothetical protein
MIFAISLFVEWQQRGSLDARSLAVPAFMIAAAFLFFTLYPQVAFKPQERTLIVDESGVKTTIGSKTATRAWREIMEVGDDGEAVVLVVETGNAFIVPARAFRDDAQRQEFLEAVTQWQTEARNNPT